MTNNLRCAYELDNFDITQAVDPTWTWPRADPEQVTVLTNAVAITDQWIEYCKTTWQLEYDHTLSFIRPRPHIDPTCHIDIDTQNPDELAPMTAINWCMGGERSRMIWWDTLNNPPTTGAYTDATGVQTAYRIWPISECKMLDSAHIGLKPTLTRICLPHSINTARPRWTISVRFKRIGDWTQTVEHFRQRGAINDTIANTDYSNSSNLD